jgi:hypothetical protein
MALDPVDQRTLEVLNEVQTRLSAALDRLRESSDPAINYRLHCADFINHSVNAYAYLRASDRARASQILVRPTIESFFRMRAVQEHPELLHGIGLHEFQEDRKFLEISPSPAASDIAFLEEQLITFRRVFAEKCPRLQPREVAVTVYDAASTLKLEEYHNILFRLYSRYTHALLRSFTGSHDPRLAGEETRAMCFCALAALETVPGTDASYVETTLKQLQNYDFLPKTPDAT